MRIAIVVNTSWNVYNFRLNLIKALLECSHEIHTVAPRDNYTNCLEKIGCLHHDIRMDSRGANPIKDFLLFAELWATYRKIKPNIILHFTAKPNIYGTLAAALLGIPMINNVCGLGTVFLKKGLVSSIALLLYKFSFKFSRKVLFQNLDDLKLFVNQRLVAAEKTVLVPGSGIDLDKFKQLPFSRNEKFTFLLISRLIKDKGVIEFVESARLILSKGIQAKFQILGSLDPDHKRSIPLEIINHWIDSGIIQYLGYKEDVRPCLGGADCVVLPSYREGAPRSLLEAASLGKPIITTDAPGCNFVVEDQYNGLLCKLKDPMDLADKMVQMMSFDNCKLKIFGENGRSKMERIFDEKFVINKYMNEIDELVEKKILQNKIDTLGRISLNSFQKHVKHTI